MPIPVIIILAMLAAFGGTVAFSSFVLHHDTGDALIEKWDQSR